MKMYELGDMVNMLNEIMNINVKLDAILTCIEDKDYTFEKLYINILSNSLQTMYISIEAAIASEFDDTTLLQYADNLRDLITKLEKEDREHPSLPKGNEVYRLLMDALQAGDSNAN